MAVPQNYISVSRRPPDIEDYIDMLRRYRSWIIGPAFAGLVVAVVVAFFWPDTYISTAVMRITPQQVPERLVPSNINTQMAERLTAMQQDILSKTSLTQLILKPELNLYAKERSRLPMEDIVDTMRNKVKIAILDTPTQGRTRFTSAFQISFAYPDRYKAQAVVAALVAKFTEQNVTVLKYQANLTTSFLSDELKSAEADLDRLDNEITKFKQQNQGRLPEQLQSNMQAVNSLQIQSGQLNEALNRNAQEKMMLETQLQNYKNQLNFVTANMEETVGAQSVKNERLINLNKIVLDLKTQLSALREVYREDHPDIRALKARIGVLEREKNQVEKDDQVQQTNEPQSKKIVNPQMARGVEELKGAIASVNAQIQAKNLDIQERIKQQAELNKAIQSYQARIEVSPTNEQKYAALLRDYGLAKAKYEEMSRKKELSETAANMEERKAGENLEVLDAASLPEQPAEPNRLLIAGIGIGLGLAVGVFLAGAKEMKDTSLKNLKDVRAYTNLPVLSSIPLLSTGRCTVHSDILQVFERCVLHLLGAGEETPTAKPRANTNACGFSLAGCSGREAASQPSRFSPALRSSMLAAVLQESFLGTSPRIRPWPAHNRAAAAPFAHSSG